MKQEDIRKLFPLKISITETDRELAICKGGLHYLGDILLTKELPKEIHEYIFWGLSLGSVKGVELKTEIEHKGKKLPLYIDSNFMDNEITFELRN